MAGFQAAVVPLAAAGELEDGRFGLLATAFGRCYNDFFLDRSLLKAEKIF